HVSSGCGPGKTMSPATRSLWNERFSAVARIAERAPRWPWMSETQRYSMKLARDRSRGGGERLFDLRKSACGGIERLAHGPHDPGRVRSARLAGPAGLDGENERRADDDPVGMASCRARLLRR